MSDADLTPTTVPPPGSDGEVRRGVWLRSPEGAMIGYEAATGDGIARLTFVWPDGREQSVRLGLGARNALRRLLGRQEMMWREEGS